MQLEGLIPIQIKDKTFETLMSVYQIALNQVVEELEQIKLGMNRIYGYEIINHITSRIKTPDSIVKKMKKKNYKLNYQNLVYNINDIAGVRAICPTKSNIESLVSIINQLPNIKVIKEKDYITKPKESGYSGYHLIVEVPVQVEEKTLHVKVEIQLRTMAMDFWATNEHKVKYKTNKKISSLDSKKMVFYARILNFIDRKISHIYQKQLE